MKLKHVIVTFLGLALLGMGLWGALPSKGSFIAGKKKSNHRRLKIKKQKRDETRRSKGMRTRFADKSFNSINVNQMLLLTKKPKMASN